MLANFKKFFCCSNTLPASYQVEVKHTDSDKNLVLPLSRMQSRVKSKIESAKELIYYSDSNNEVYSINLSDIVNISTITIKKVVFGTGHCLILLCQSDNPDKTFLAGFGANSNGQLGLDVFSKNSSDEDLNRKNTYDKVVLVQVFKESQKIIDIAACQNFSLVLVEDISTHQKKLYRFELSQDELFNLGNFTVNRTNPVKLEICSDEIIENISHIYAKNGRILLQDDKESAIYIKGMLFNMDICVKYKLFKKFPSKKISQISLGLNHCIILFTDNSLMSIGHNEYGELGAKCFNPKQLNPLNFYEGHTIQKISTGLRHNLVLCEDGTLFAFGDNGAKQCLGDYDFYLEPKVMNIKDVYDIECGGKFSIIKNTKGEVYAWGECYFLFKEELFTNYMKTEDNIRIINDIKLKKITGIYAGENAVVFYAEEFK